MPIIPNLYSTQDYVQAIPQELKAYSFQLGIKESANCYECG